MALSDKFVMFEQWSLLGAKRTCLKQANAAIDPERTSANISYCRGEAGFSPIKALV